MIEKYDNIKNQIYSHPKLGRRIAIIIFGILAFVSYTVLVSLNLNYARERELQTGYAQQSSLSKILVSHAEATLKKIDTALLSVQLQLSNKSEESRPKPSVINNILASHLALIGESQSLRVSNAYGHFIYDASGILHSATISDRDYFLRNRDNPYGGLVISKPLYARITHNWVVTLSRAIVNEKGQFAGLIQAAVRAEYFQSIYASLDLSKHHNITLFNDKLQIIATSSPQMQSQLGKTIDSSILRDFVKSKDLEKSYTSNLEEDGTERYYIARKVGQYPLYIIVSHTVKDQLFEWNRQLIWSIVGIFVLAFVLIGWIVVWLRSYDSALALANRMTSAYEKTLQEIQYLAEHDFLTDLPNRTFLEEYMNSLTKNQEEKIKIALLFLDLDHFKDVNDTLGHTVGDKLLIQVAKRLIKILDNKSIICRQGGDEFVILLKEYPNSFSLSDTAQRLIKAIEKPFLVDAHEFVISASIGISIYPQHGTDVITLLKNADTAMYQSKADGGGKYHFFNEEMNIKVLNRVDMISNLRQAIINNEFVLHYQPQVDGFSGRIIGVEALIRWNHPKEGEISPVQFIPAAEESGLINPIGDWVLKEACKQAKIWKDKGLPSLTMAVNVSAVQLRQADFIDKVMSIVKNSGLSADCIELEITESALIRDTQRIVKILEKLREEGIRLSVDDFGTGYSSLGYLKHLPFNKIKIDQSFVRGVPQNEDDVSITQAIIGLAKSLKMELIAEGVETQEQCKFLLNQDCQEMQGYYFGKPMPASKIEELL
ncbi:MAG: EAL domain-containing protein [Halarcobacter sp.]